MNYCIDASVIDRIGYPQLLFVDRASDRQLKKYLAVFASHFKSEMGFDHLQFDEFMFRNEDYVGFLVLERALDLVKHEDEHPCRIVGGGVFAERSDGYELDWVWLHPFARNRGLFGACWKEFQKRFGQFSVAQPLSAQMKAFLDKHPLGRLEQSKG